MKERIVVAGDCGGTNFRLESHLECAGVRKNISARTYQTKDVKDFKSTFYDFLRESNLPPEQIDAIVIPIAGPIEGRIGRFTNVDLVVDVSDFKLPIALINDFRANGYAVGLLGSAGIKCIQLKHPVYGYGKPIPGKPIGIIGPGTGCGVSRIHFLDNKMYILDSEGSHVYAPIDASSELDVELANYLGWDGEVHLEGLASGLMMEQMFNFYSKKFPNDVEMTDYRATEEKDRGAFIAKTSKKDKDSISRRIMTTVYKYTGRGAHNLADHERALGGIYILGGMLPKDLPMPYGKHDEFIELTIMEQFAGRCRSPHDKTWLKDIPVYAGIDPRVGIKGALELALNKELFEKERVN